MDFYDYYKSITDRTERIRLRDKVTRLCHISYTTFYSWTTRKVIPILAQEKISEILEMPIDELFPKKTETETEKL